MPVPSRSNSTSSSSQLPRVLLQVNPGIGRQLDDHLLRLDKLKLKAERTADYNRRRFGVVLEERREKKIIHVERRTKIDEETRNAVDKIRAERRKLLEDRAERQKDEQENGQQSTRSKKRRQRRFSEESVQRAWTPTSAVASSAADQWPESTSQAAETTPTAMEDESPTSPSQSPVVEKTATNIRASAVSSRRSSLRSGSMLELEGLARSDSPGPAATEEVMEGFAEASPSTRGPSTTTAVGTRVGSAAGSRRSSLSSSLMPEVVVTQAKKLKGAGAAEGAADEQRANEDENKLQPPDKGMRIWNLLPAPTPTRFVGRMHAIVSGNPEKRRRAESFSRKPSIASETIQEDEADVESNRSLALSVESKSESADNENEDEEEKHADDQTANASNKKRVESVAASVTNTAKMAGKLMRKGDDSKASSAASKRHAWKSMAQQSREIVEHHKKGKAAAAVIAASTAQSLASKQFGKGKSKKMKAASDTRKLGGTVMKIYQRESHEILDQFGTLDESGSFDDDESGLSVPGMKREFKLERVDPGLPAKESNVSDNTSSFTTSMDQQSSAVQQDQQPQDLASVFSRISSRQTTSRPVSALSQGGEIHSFGELMKGMQTTSKLVGKLHSIRAGANDEHQSGTGGSGGGAGGSGSFGKNGGDPDDRWDWMTGVPTSIRFVAKSWRSVIRGPGGIVTQSPLLQVKNESRWKSISSPDFAGTVNMLTVLAKADLKLRSQAREAAAAAAAAAEEDSEHSGLGRRRSTGGGGAKSRLSPSHMAAAAAAGTGAAGGASSPSLRSGQQSPGSSGGGGGGRGGIQALLRTGSRESTFRTDDDANDGDSTDRDEGVRKLFNDLVLVQKPNIAKWNVDRSIKEDKGGEPFLLKYPQKSIIHED